MPAATQRRAMTLTREALQQVLASGGMLPDGQLRKQFVSEIKQLEAGAAPNRSRQFIISTGAIDRDNDTIDQAGWHLDNYRNNPVVLWAHDYNSLPVGRCTDIRCEGGKLIAVAEFADHPMAETVLRLLDGGFMRATSVGFRPIKAMAALDRDGVDFQEQELLEFSIVPVPANPEALIMARSKGIDLAPLQAWADSTLVALKAVQKVQRTTSPQVMPDSVAPAGQGTEGQVPAASTATGLLCPACGAEYDGDVCEGCGWSSPDGQHPMTLPNQGGAAVATFSRGALKARPEFAAAMKVAGTWQYSKGAVPMARRLAQPSQAMGGQSCIGKTDDEDPLRWNRQHAKSFDVGEANLEPQKLEYAWASKFLEVPVRDISESTSFVPSARLGSFLSAMEESVSAWKSEGLRNMTEGGREAPPVYELMQLNSLQSRNFLVAGMRFLRRVDDNVKMVAKLQQTWSGLYLTTYTQRAQAQVADDFVTNTWKRAMQLNYLKGEAFTLSGEFLDRGDLDWPDIFLEASQERTLRRIADRVNAQGEDMESRGCMIMGPPGTGKTLGARVMMSQVKSTFIWISARDFYRAGAYGAFTYAFDLAAECAPTILCFEDVDNYLHGEIIDLLKTEMDGMKRRKGIQTIMTTNFPELVPDALIDRPGRFDELMEIDLPTLAVRARMLRAWLPELPAPSVDDAAASTANYSGAHIRELAKFSRTIAAEEKCTLEAALVLALEKIKEQRELVASLRQAPDYRPGRTVRMAVQNAKAYVAKRGRVLSAANEGKLRQAGEHVAAAQAHMDSVLASLPAPMADGDGDEGKLVLVLADEAAEVPETRQDDGLVLRLATDDEIAVTSDDIREAIRRAVEEMVSGLGPMVVNETQAALARARGLVD